MVTTPGVVAGASTTKFYLVVGSTRKNLKGVQVVPELGPGASSDGAAVALSVFSDTNPGIYSVQACADADEVVTEVSNTNNCKTAAGTDHRFSSRPISS